MEGEERRKKGEGRKEEARKEKGEGEGRSTLLGRNPRTEDELYYPLRKTRNVDLLHQLWKPPNLDILLTSEFLRTQN